MKKYDLEIKPLCEHGSYSPYGFYAKGHHNKDEFHRRILEEESCELEYNNIIHKYMRVVPYKMDNGEMLLEMIDAKTGSKGSFPVTYCEF